MLRKHVVGLATAFAVLTSGIPANATTITDNFSFSNSASTVIASGSFSFNSSAPAQLSYADLISFSTSVLSGPTYDLTYVNSLGAGAYKYFGYNWGSNTWVPAAIPGSVGPYSGILAGTDLSTGFFIDALIGQADPAGTGADGILANYSPFGEDTVASFSVSQTPLPSPLVLFGSALGLLGLLGYRRRNARSTGFAA